MGQGGGLLLCHFMATCTLTEIHRHALPDTKNDRHTCKYTHMCAYLDVERPDTSKQRHRETHASHRHTCVDRSGHTADIHTHAHMLPLTSTQRDTAHQADVSRPTETHAPDTQTHSESDTVLYGPQRHRQLQTTWAKSTRLDMHECAQSPTQGHRQTHYPQPHTCPPLDPRPSSW